MKTQLKPILSAAMATLLAMACATTSPRSFESVVDNAESKGSSYTEVEWDAADAKYEEFLEKYSDMETLRSLTPEERKEVGRLTARYAKVRMQYAANQMKDVLGVGSDIMKGFFEELNLADPEAMEGIDELMNGLNGLFELE